MIRIVSMLILCAATVHAASPSMWMMARRARMATAPTAWTPSNAVVRLWFDAADMSTLQCSNTVSVTNWLDKSGSGYNAQQMTIDSRPTISTNLLNGKNVVYFSYDEYLLRTIDTTLLKNLSNAVIFCVIKPNIVPSASTPFSIQAGAGNARVYMQWTTTNILQVGGRRLDADSYQSISITNAAVKEWSMVVTVIDYVNSNLQVRINGTAYDRPGGFQTPGLSQNGDSSTFGVGGSYAQTAFIYGWIAEIGVIYGKDDVANIETYLRAKWGTP